MFWIRIEANAYWTLFATALAGIALWEVLAPWRRVSRQLVRRWVNHAILLSIYSLLSMLLLRTGAVMTAVAVQHSSFGLLHRNWLPFWAQCLLGILLLDLTRYALHRAFHAVPLLWRFHQIHHSDADFDLSTGFRAHPFEGLVGQAGYFAAVAILAPPPGAVLVAELLSLSETFFSHANASLPKWMEGPLRRVFITPEMHRIHHSEEIPEQNKNLGDIFPWWDRLFGTYLENPAAGYEAMATGLKELRAFSTQSLIFLLTLPFRSESSLSPQSESAAASAAAGD